MKFMVSWTTYPGKWQEATNRFLKMRAEHRPPVKGVQPVGEWISIDSSRGWSVVESESVDAVYEGNAQWSDLMELHTVPILSHDEAEPILRKAAR